MKPPVAATNLPASPPLDPDSQGLDARVEASFDFRLNMAAKQQQHGSGSGSSRRYPERSG